MMNIGETIDIVITRTESGFDRACDSAYKTALSRFGINEDGHSNRVTGWERSSCYIEVNSLRYIRTNNEHNYLFLATTKKSDN